MENASSTKPSSLFDEFVYLIVVVNLAATVPARNMPVADAGP